MYNHDITDPNPTQVVVAGVSDLDPRLPSDTPDSILEVIRELITKLREMETRIRELKSRERAKDAQISELESQLEASMDICRKQDNLIPFPNSPYCEVCGRS